MVVQAEMVVGLTIMAPRFQGALGGVMEGMGGKVIFKEVVVVVAITVGEAAPGVC